VVRCLASGLLVGLVGCVTPGEGAVDVLATFDAAEGEHPEAVLVDPDGAVWVSLHRSMRLWRRDATGTLTVSQLPGADDDTTRLNGLAWLGGIPWGLVRSDDARHAGLWDLRDSARRVVPLDAGAELNGLAADSRRERLYATDDDGRILVIDPFEETAEVWSSHPDLAPRNDRSYGAGTYGANGIAVTADAVWVSNPATASILALAIREDGTAGVPEPRLVDAEVGEIDDFDLDARGRWIGAALGDDALRLVDDGVVRELATRANDLDQPTAVAFDPRDEQTAYLANGAFWRVGRRRPSVMRVTWSP